MDLTTLPRYPDASYRYITTGDNLKAAIQSIGHPSEIGIDIETTGIDPFTDAIRLVQIAVQNMPVLVIDLMTIPPKQWSPLKRLLQSNILKVGHGLKFEKKFLETAGIGFNGPFFDTELAFKVYLAGRKISASLQSTVARILKRFLDKTEQKSNFRGTLRKQQLQYGANDAVAPLDLKPILIDRLQRGNGRLWAIAEELEFPCLEVTANMELNGMKFDHNRWKRLGKEIELRRSCAKAMVMQLQRVDTNQLSLLPQITDTVNPNSWQQILPALQAMGIPIQSTSERELTPHAHKYPVVQALLDYRHLSKFTNTLAEGLPQHIHPVTGRVHGNWFQLGARSGRYSCQNPPLQTIPRTDLARRCFVAEPGWKIIKADYSQIELRILARLCGDEPLIKAFLTGQDVHALTAALIFGKSVEHVTPEERAVGKIINFGIIYGMGAKKLKQTLESDANYFITLKEASQFIDNFYAGHPQIKRWQEQIRRNVFYKGGNDSYTLAGRRRVWKWKDKPPINEIINHPVQGSNADITKLALRKLNEHLKRRRLSAKIIAVLHDEIVVECPDAEVTQVIPLINKVMVRAAERWLKPTPIAVDIKVGNSWGSDSMNLAKFTCEV